MPNVRIHKAGQLRPQTRSVIEAELGRALAEDEDVTIMAFSPHEAPAGKARRDAARKLEETLRRADRKGKGTSSAEVASALNEALRRARPGYRERE